MDINHIGLHQLYAFLLVFARMAGVIVSAPFLSNKAIPLPAKAGLALVLSLAVTPLAAQKIGPVPENMLLLAGQVLGDALFGMALGYFASLLFASVEMAGYFIDTQMGFGFVNLINPFSEQQSSIMSGFAYQLSLTVYISINGHLLLLGAMVESFQKLPPGTISFQSSFGMAILPMLKLMFALGFRLALPAVGVLLVMEVAFGLVARMVPQVNVFIVGIPAKVIVGITTVALLLPTLSVVVGQLVAGTSVGLSALIAGSK